MIGENFGKTMQTLEDENNTELGKLCRKQVADFVLNLLKMEIEIGDKKLILLDNHAENLTFDQKNGVRLIDLSYKRDLPIFAWNCPEQIRIVFNKMIKNANTGEALTIRRLCTESRYSELTKDQKSLVKIYFESVL